jgi:zinc transporter ZupT
MCPSYRRWMEETPTSSGRTALASSALAALISVVVGAFLIYALGYDRNEAFWTPMVAAGLGWAALSSAVVGVRRHSPVDAAGWLAFALVGYAIGWWLILTLVILIVENPST